MPRNELLVFRILRILRTKQVQYLDERQIMTAIQRETGDEFNASTIQAPALHAAAWPAQADQSEAAGKRLCAGLGWLRLSGCFLKLRPWCRLSRIPGDNTGSPAWPENRKPRLPGFFMAGLAV
jgi:hypothetical protein